VSLLTAARRRPQDASVASSTLYTPKHWTASRLRSSAAGRSPRPIAANLNRDGIPGPFGRTWGDTTIRGHASRGNGHCQQRALRRCAGLEPAALHQGPEYGQARVAPEPAAKWIRTEVLELRIVDDGLWRWVKLRQAELAKQFEATTKGVRAARAERLNRLRRPAFLLSGLLTCGCAAANTGSSSTIAMAVLVISAKGSAKTVAPFAVTTSSGVC
jgi:hypothetical protein